MDSPINLSDKYYHSKEPIILTQQELNLPGIRLFATHNIRNAIFPHLPHYHENAFEFTFISRGCFSFHTQGSEYEVSGGNIFISFPDEVHSTNEVPISLNEQYWLQVDISDPKNLLFLNEETAEQLIRDLKGIKRHIISTDIKETRPLIEKAFELALSNGNHLLIAGYLIIFFQLMIAASKEDRYYLTHDIEAAVQYVDEHVTEELSLHTLAGICNLSVSQFKQKFRRIVGISPRNYINKKKINFSKMLLLKDIPVTEVAMQLNFNTSSYFSTVFKKYTALTPSEYIQAELGNKENE
ncbi:helix-turn-helix transcriptional regulator [Lacrimispora sp.]|uniref:helix-turn-helix transcriptional regulator n=1 Tax=Lacrimispora sp. TaxID=2719234 RepID=UPI00289CD1FF|nr:AraC family transcriptional regulator [Lacrimispora sp.]